MNRFLRYIFLFFTGGTAYILVELMWRGYSHISMFIVGGICFAGLAAINRRKNIRLLEKCLFGSILITTAELISGIFINIILKLDVWDYSELSFNILGQISLIFTVAWFFLCLPAFMLCKYAEKFFDKMVAYIGSKRDSRDNLQ